MKHYPGPQGTGLLKGKRMVKPECGTTQMLISAITKDITYHMPGSFEWHSIPIRSITILMGRGQTVTFWELKNMPKISASNTSKCEQVLPDT